LGVLSAAAQLFDQSIRVLGRIRKAHQRQKALLDVLAQHESELSSVRAMIGIIQDEKDLQTANVYSEVMRLKDVQEKLVKLLGELDPRLKKPVLQFAHQLTKGSSDETRLFGIMSELGQVKSMLLLRIQVANVGVMRDMQQGLVANTEVIARVDEFLREEVGSCEGLKIARLLQGRDPSGEYSCPRRMESRC
jgi:ribosome-binding factor A